MGLRLRRIMRQWLTGVSILTAREGEHVRGMTCNSFNSVSDSPATVLVSIRRGTRTHEMVSASGLYALSILPDAAERWANRFAGLEGDAAQDRFEDVPHRLSPAGLPWATTRPASRMATRSQTSSTSLKRWELRSTATSRRRSSHGSSCR
jgi:flavin reductase